LAILTITVTSEDVSWPQNFEAWPTQGTIEEKSAWLSRPEHLAFSDFTKLKVKDNLEQYRQLEMVICQVAGTTSLTPVFTSILPRHDLTARVVVSNPDSLPAPYDPILREVEAKLKSDYVSKTMAPPDHVALWEIWMRKAISRYIPRGVQKWRKVVNTTRATQQEAGSKKEDQTGDDDKEMRDVGTTEDDKGDEEAVATTGSVHTSTKPRSKGKEAEKKQQRMRFGPPLHHSGALVMRGGYNNQTQFRDQPESRLPHKGFFGDFIPIRKMVERNLEIELDPELLGGEQQSHVTISLAGLLHDPLSTTKREDIRASHFDVVKLWNAMKAVDPAFDCAPEPAGPAPRRLLIWVTKNGSLIEIDGQDALQDALESMNLEADQYMREGGEDIQKFTLYVSNRLW
jgi:hypothetical protein